MNFTVKNSGVGEVIQSFEAKCAEVIQGCRARVLAVGTRIRDEARSNAPRDTGNLASSIDLDIGVDGLSAEISTEVEYAAFVELGTGRRGAGSAQETLPAGYSYGSSAGMGAQPFLWPALQSNENEFNREVEQHLRTVWR